MSYHQKDQQALIKDSNFTQNQISFISSIIKKEISFNIKDYIDSVNSKQREYDNKITSQIKDLNAQLEQLYCKISDIKSIVHDNWYKINKVEELSTQITYLTNKSVLHDVKINTLSKDLLDFSYKYDTMVINNLLVPGQIGDYCKFKNLQDFLSYAVKQFKIVENYQEASNVSWSAYKSKLEMWINQFNIQITTFTDTSFKYTVDKVNALKEYLLELIKDVERKFPLMQMENNWYVKRWSNELKEVQEQKRLWMEMKEEYNKIFKEKVETINWNNEETAKKIGEYKSDFLKIKRHFMEWAEFIKDVRFRTNVNHEIMTKGQLKKLANSLSRDALWVGSEKDKEMEEVNPDNIWGELMNMDIREKNKGERFRNDKKTRHRTYMSVGKTMNNNNNNNWNLWTDSAMWGKNVPNFKRNPQSQSLTVKNTKNKVINSRLVESLNSRVYPLINKTSNHIKTIMKPNGITFTEPNNIGISRRTHSPRQIYNSPLKELIKPKHYVNLNSSFTETFNLSQDKIINYNINCNNFSTKNEDNKGEDADADVDVEGDANGDADVEGEANPEGDAEAEKRNTDIDTVTQQRILDLENKINFLTICNNTPHLKPNLSSPDMRKQNTMVASNNQNVFNGNNHITYDHNSNNNNEKEINMNQTLWTKNDQSTINKPKQIKSIMKKKSFSLSTHDKLPLFDIKSLEPDEQKKSQMAKKRIKKHNNNNLPLNRGIDWKDNDDKVKESQMIIHTVSSHFLKPLKQCLDTIQLMNWNKKGS